ncbi:unnamed protein product, partial [Ectocarpus fasciculatus]
DEEHPRAGVLLVAPGSEGRQGLPREAGANQHGAVPVPSGVRGVRAQHAESGVGTRTRPKPQEHRAIRFRRQSLGALKGSAMGRPGGPEAGGEEGAGRSGVSESGGFSRRGHEPPQEDGGRGVVGRR